MKQIKWFDRKFKFSDEQNIFPSIIERLSGTPIRLADKLSRISSERLRIRDDGSWTIMEHIGHLIDLEPIWTGRLDDILSDAEEMRAADLENKKTHLANHNDRNIDDLLREFSEIRQSTIIKLEKLTEQEVFKSALHPRLKQPMRLIDLFLFVAEHDDHHLADISRMSLS